MPRADHPGAARVANPDRMVGLRVAGVQAHRVPAAKTFIITGKLTVGRRPRGLAGRGGTA